ncbi:tyrosine-type recombinase/integrase [Pseudomonas sp. R5(2019)]|uniref:tyrosine-type recombinase/integrase n=1 Tax=Pseudomonas sp. R5(2019) TaxID=2697566 RepID=UPI0035326014
MRPSEIMALRWTEVDEDKRTARVCRIVADRQIQERVKNKKNRVVLLDDRALGALKGAKENAMRQAARKMQHAQSPYVFPPSKGAEFIQETSVLDKHFKQALAALSLRERPQYNCRHTYATLCLMAGMNTAFIASQLGHSVQMLLSTYARWISSASDWNEMSKLGMSEMGTK